MGYRSDIKVLLPKSAWSEFKQAILETDSIDKYDKEWFFECASEKDLPNSKDVVVVAWEWVKWNEWDSAIIQAFMDWLRKRDSEDLPFHFIRMGEEVGDIEELYNYGIDWEYEEDYERIYIVSEIAVSD